MGDGNDQPGYKFSSSLRVVGYLTYLLDAEIPYDLHLMLRSLTAWPIFARRKLSCVSQL